MDSKRQRSENFTLQDKELLLERVDERKDIVEMKKTDAASAKAKEQAWQDIANNYNALSSFPRTPIALKMCWENLKRKCRKTYAEEINAIKSGKRHSVIQSDPLIEKVRDILNLSSDSHHNSFFDSSALYNDGSDSHNMSSGIKEENSSDFGDRRAICYQGYAAIKWKESSPYKKRPAADILKSSEKKMSSKTSPYIQTLTSETSESETQDNDETDSFVQATSSYSQSCSSKLNKASNSKTGDERRVLGESSKTSPYVQRLTTETTSDGETPHEDAPIARVNNNRNSIRWQSRKRPHQVNSLADLLTDSKIELVKLAKEHAILDERRRSELHYLQVEETRLKIVEEKKRIALYELRAKETELKIEVLKTRLENGIFD